MKKSLCIALILLLFLQFSVPAAATESEALTEPAAATEPAVTTEPVVTTETVVTTEPTEPTNPTEPTDPTEPTEPPEPEHPEDRNHKPYINGMPDGSFRPYVTLSRAQLAVIIFSQGDYEPGDSQFPDVPENLWFTEAVNALAAVKLFSGFPDGTFHPNSPITRAELVSVLARLSGESCEEAPGFPDVSEDFWAYKAIALARSKGWVSGYPDGSFGPGRGVTRAEATAMLNRFWERQPDKEAIDLGEGVRYFPDVQKIHWFYYSVLEAATTHTAHYEDWDSPEHWLDISSRTTPIRPDGFYCFGTELFVVQDGAYIRQAVTGAVGGFSFCCEGASGICTAAAEVLPLASGELILLSGGKPLGEPGTYSDGLYLKAGHLYAAKDGKILHAAGSGTANGVSYVCTGASGRCEVEDWTQLSLPGIDLSVFAEGLTEDALSSSGSSVTVFQALQAAVRVYETYFRVEYPTTQGSDDAWIDKAMEYGILEDPHSDYNSPAERGEVAIFLYRALRGRELEAINSIDGIPDLSEDSDCWPFLMALYKAGVIEGVGTEHEAQIHNTLSAQELGLWLTRLELREQRVRFTIELKLIETIQYGTSGSGTYPLTACRLGDGKNVLVLSFAIHGWEDNWDRDGAELVYLADQVKAYLEQHYSLVKNGNWTVYILRCLNPDGLYLGTTCNGPGRCTTTYYNASGQLVSGKGIDMNRCFPYNFTPRTDARNFNGTAPLQCKEARAVANFIQSVKGSGYNVCIDTHGWYGQIICSTGKGSIYQVFSAQFPNSSYTYLSGGSGYLTGWTGFVLGFDSCLLELPKGIYSHSAFLNAGCVWRFENAIAQLLSHYNGPGTTKYSHECLEIEPDGN